MGRNLFAPREEAQQAEQPKKGRNLFNGDANRARPTPYQVGEAAQYRKYYEDKENRSGITGALDDLNEYLGGGPEATFDPEYRQFKSGPIALLSRYGNYLSRGFGDEATATAVGALTGDGYDKTIDTYRNIFDKTEANSPYWATAGDIAGVATDIAAFRKLPQPATWYGRLGYNTAVGTGLAGLQGFGDGRDGIGNRLEGAAELAPWGFGAGIAGSVVEGVGKGIGAGWRKGRESIRRITDPKGSVKRIAASAISDDWNNYARLADEELQAGGEMPTRRFLTPDEANTITTNGGRVQLSDFGGDALRADLQAAANLDSRARSTMLGKADVRQEGQGNRIADEINGLYDGDTNSYDIVQRVKRRGREINEANYRAAFSDPKAGHFWGDEFANVLSTPEGEQALREATNFLRTNAMRGKVPFYEPVFGADATGRMQFQGFRAPNGELFQGSQGLNLNFWNQFKISLDEQIKRLYKADAGARASQLKDLKNEMLGAIDNQLGSDVYSRARGDAKEVFDLVGRGSEDGALQAGAEYFRRMGSISASEARAGLNAMNEAERELFARGYAGELINSIRNMGDNEDVSKLFKSSEARAKMRDALGPANADKIEALLHGEQVGGLLRKVLQGGSDTARKLFTAENLRWAGKESGTAAVMGGAGYLATGDTSGLIVGLAMRGGYKFVDRVATIRMARALAELANTEDPKVINEILEMARQNPEFMAFARAAGSGASRASRAAGNAAGASARPAPQPALNQPQGNDWGGGRVEPRFAGGGLVKEAVEGLSRLGRSTVRHPVRKAFPGIYKDPRLLLEEVQIAPEDPALKQLFGVTRDDLFEISKRKGNVDDILGLKDKVSRGSEATDNIKVPRNANRLVSALEAARSNEGLWKGMHGWYVMDPAYQRLVQLYGPEQAAIMFRRMNTLTGMSSPGSEVVTELQRGTAANMMDNLGRFDEFLEKGGIGKELRGQGFPKELEAVDGHPYHSTSQAPAMDKFLRTGRVEMGSAKVPTYIGASTPPELGNFTDLPVADAHFTRALGLPDTRTAEKVYDHSMSMGEYKATAPWFRDEVANASDLESVPAQAILWGLYGPQTGVTTAVGAPKLELLAKGIMETARRLGISPDLARDLVLSGRAHAYRDGGLVSALAQASPDGSSGSGV